MLYLLLILLFVLLFSSVSFNKKTGKIKLNTRIKVLNKKYNKILATLVSSLSHKYTNVEMINEGGFSVIAKAQDNERQRPVSIKTLLPEFIENKEIIDQFLLESEIIQTMNHPNIIRLFEAGAIDEKNMYFYIMEYLDGNTLEAVIERKEYLSNDFIIRVGLHVARALNHMHCCGIIHRDIKPSNLFITNKNITKIIDFGIAKLLKHEEDNAKNAGTIQFCSPEQMKGEKITNKSDIYSLALCLYYMKFKKMPFKNSDVLSKILYNPDNSNIKSTDSLIDKKLMLIINQCLNPNPEKRLTANQVWFKLKAIKSPSQTDIKVPANNFCMAV